MPAPSRPVLFRVALVSAWLLVVLGPPCLFSAWREQRLAELAEPEARRGWETFRQDMRRQSGGDGPVQRKVPRSAEQPELVWLRDHATLAVVAWMTFGGLLAGILAALVLGVTSTTEQQPCRGRHTDEQRD